MTKKRKRYPDLNEKMERPWCFYCERDFDDLKILISHQKAKHFKCDRCGRRLNTAGGLNVHMSQVHKEPLNRVENAIQGRGGLDLEIFGMEGVPPEAIAQHQNHVREKHFSEAEQRRLLTGNPTSGAYHNTGMTFKSKRPRVKEDLSELAARVESFEADKLNGVIPAAGQDIAADAMQGIQVTGPPGAPVSFPAVSAPFTTPYPAPFTNNTAPFYATPKPQNHAAHGLPARPGPPGAPGMPAGSSLINPEFDGALDELIASAKDQTATAAAQTTPVESTKEKPKKEKKEAILRFNQDFFSPEEMLANMPRYNWT